MVNVYPSPSRCNRDTSPRRGFFLYHLRRDFFVSFLLFLLSQKKKQEKPDGKRKKKKGSAVSLGALEKRLFRIKCSDRFSSLRRDCGYHTRPQIRQYRICWSPQMVGRGRLLTARREHGGDRLWAEIVRPPLAVDVAVIVCRWWLFVRHSPFCLLNFYRLSARGRSRGKGTRSRWCPLARQGHKAPAELRRRFGRDHPRGTRFR